MRVAIKPLYFFLVGLGCMLVLYTLLQMAVFMGLDALPSLIRRLPNSPTRMLLLISYAVGAGFLYLSGLERELRIWHLVQVPLLACIFIERGYERFFGPAPDAIHQVCKMLIRALRDYSMLLYLVLGGLRRFSRTT